MFYDKKRKQKVKNMRKNVERQVKICQGNKKKLKI